VPLHRLWGGVLFPAPEGITLKKKSTRARARFTLRLPKPLWKTIRRCALTLDVPAVTIVQNALALYSAGLTGRKQP